jgi:hypothetical protein
MEKHKSIDKPKIYNLDWPKAFLILALVFIALPFLVSVFLAHR